MEREFLAVAEIAKQLNVSIAQTYRLIAARKVPGAKVAGVIRIPRIAWERWLAEQAAAALANCNGVEARKAR